MTSVPTIGDTPNGISNRSSSGIEVAFESKTCMDIKCKGYTKNIKSYHKLSCYNTVEYSRINLV